MTPKIIAAVEPGRLSTGVPGLDVLTEGGLVRGGIYLVFGRPGTGKTILANQLCFHHVDGGGRAAYVTLLAESHSRMVGNLRDMTFVRPDVVGDAMTYLGGYSALREAKLTGLLELMRRIIRDHKPSLLVLDGLGIASSMVQEDVALKEFIIELQMLSSMTGCTTVALANLRADDASGPEHSMVDGLLELTLNREVQRPLREIEILKFRGSSHMLGRHDFTIDTTGVRIYPRTEELLAKAAPPAPRRTVRLSTGIDRLDDMLGGGLESGTTTILLGFAGSGKTMLSSEFLGASTATERGMYFGFYESPERLLTGADSVGIGLRDAVQRGDVEMHWQSPMRYGLDELANRLLTLVSERHIKRLVIDGLDGIRQASVYPERTIRVLTAIVNRLRAMDVTTLITEETQKLFGPEVEIRIAGMSALVDNILLLEYLDHGAELKRLLSVIKQRGASYDAMIRELTIDKRGLVLAKTGESAAKILDAGSRRANGRSRREHPKRKPR